MDRSRSPADLRGQAHGRKGGRIAFATLATADYSQGALVLTAGLRSRLPDHVQVVVYSDAELSLVPGVLLRPLSDLPDVPPAGEPLMPNFKFCWRKLGLWSLEEFDVIVYMDSDIVILGNVENILQYIPPTGQLAASPACECWRSESCSYTDAGGRCGPGYFNAGVLVLRPKKSEFLKMMETLDMMKQSETMQFAEQDFLNVFFADKVHRLPPAFNALQHAMVKPKHRTLSVSKCIALHFVMGKPWSVMTRLEEDFQDLRKLWRKAYEEFAPRAFLRPLWPRHRVHEKLPLFLVRNYITSWTEASLLDTVYGPLLEDRWIQLRSRELLCLGGVPHPDGAICEELPSSLQVVAELLKGEMSSAPNQCLINKYRPGQGIDAHSDGPRFESEVAILSLEGPAVMHFTLVEKKAYPLLPPRLEVFLEPRSLLLITGDAYELYVHRIDHAEVDVSRGEEIQRAPRRTSLTFRSLKHVLLRSEEVSDEPARKAKDAQWQWWNSQISEID